MDVSRRVTWFFSLSFRIMVIACMKVGPTIRIRTLRHVEISICKKSIQFCEVKHVQKVKKNILPADSSKDLEQLFLFYLDTENFFATKEQRKNTKPQLL